ncbi:MAG: hypothetical protein M3460_23665 [Actinomycetota bacterium]|nr:hypothetical protein [Actinomycetota bacterium]
MGLRTSTRAAMPTTGDSARALELIESLTGALVAAANPPSMSYRGDSTAYRRNHRQLKRILVALGIKQPLPWPNLEEGVAAKSQFRHT